MSPDKIQEILSAASPAGGFAVSGEGSLPLRVAVLTNVEGLEAIREEWDELLLATGGSLFAGPDWILAWLRAFMMPGVQTHTIVAFEHDRLRLVAPLVRQAERVGGMRLACVRSATNDHTPRYSWVTDLDKSQCWSLVLSALGTAGPWHVLRLDFIDPDDGLLAGVSCLESVSHSVNEPGMVSPYLPIRGSWDEYYGGLSSKFRKNNRYALRKLEEDGKVAFETVRASDRLRSLLNEAFEVEQSSWKGQTKTAIANHTNQIEFYDQVAHRCLARSRFELHTLRVDDRMIAFQYCVALGSTYSLVKVGYDPEWARYSPGTLLLQHVLEQVITGASHDVYDMLGVANDWKLRWGPALRPMRQLTVYRGSSAGRFAYFTEVAARRWAKRVPGLARLRALIRERGK